MIAALIQAVDSLFQGHGLPFTRFLHGMVLVLLGLVWAVPLLGPLERRWRRWWPFWKCFKCGARNSKKNSVCGKCLAGLADRALRPLPRLLPGVWRRWVIRPIRFGLYALFYSVTVSLAFLFFFFRFDHRALEEFLATGTIVMTLLMFYRFFHALGPRGGLMVERVLSVMRGGFSGVFVCVFLLAWLAAPSTRVWGQKKFAVTPDGVLRFVNRPSQRTAVSRRPETDKMIVPVASALFHWPALGVHRWVVLRVGGMPTVPPWVGRWIPTWASPPETPELLSVRWVRNTRPFDAAAPGIYEVTLSDDGRALVLTRTTT